MTKIPQINGRKIGAVVIIDLKGEFIGPWALRAKENIGSLIAKNKNENILINLKDVSTIDSLGVKAIMENVPQVVKGGIVSGKMSVMEMFERLVDLRTVKVFHNEEEIVEQFGLDFVNDEQSRLDEQRKSPRLKTALPLEFWYTDTTGEKITFRAIITDLSEGGLFAEYLDVESYDAFHKCIEPNELKQLYLKIRIPQSEYIHAEGTVARVIISGEQVGIGVKFSSLCDEDRKRISDFLAL